MLGQVHGAHAAGADVLQQFVFAEQEAAILAIKQLVSVPCGDDAFGDEKIGESF